MNHHHHFVPDFETDDDYLNANTTSSSSNLPRKPIIGQDEEDDLMELLWHNGQVILHNQRPNAKKHPSSSSAAVKLHNGGGGEAATAPPPLDHNLFIQEDEMSSWLHYPLRDDDFCSDLLFPAAPTSERQTTNQVTAARPPVPSSVRPPETPSMRPPVPSSVRPPVPSPVRLPPVTSSVRPPVRNFMNFSRLRADFNGRGESGPKPIVRESTQVNPSARPSSAGSESDLSRRTDGIDFGSAAGGGAYTFGTNRKGKAVATTEPASENHGASSSVASKSEIEAVNEHPKTGRTIVDERKRKEREATDETECRNEEGKQGRGSTSTKRSRAAEVHNLSERKRRDRINERMKALQELIPRCNKSDKASMLDEAIEYMKSLQLQIQMMSMGCGMMPMMYTSMQQYMPHMAMGMGMGMDMGMNRPPPPPPFMQFPNMLPSQRPLPPQARMGSYPVQASDPSRVYGSNQPFDPNSNQAQYPGYMDPYQQFRSLHPSQPPQFQFQNQAASYPSSSRVSSSKESEDQGNQTTS